MKRVLHLGLHHAVDVANHLLVGAHDLALGVPLAHLAANLT